MRLVNKVGLVLTLMELLERALAHGLSTFQCPNGFFLSRFSSAYDGSERVYKFGCSRFSTRLTTFNETCTTTEVASTENGDMYLDCPGDGHYTVGVEVIEDVGEAGVDTWQLLCCHSDSVQVRTADCIDTKFINDARRSSSFSSSTQVIRRWQAMQEEGDKRWWFQLCPVDIIRAARSDGSQSSEGRYRRQVPWSWSRRRFPPSVEDHNPIFSKQLRAGAEQRGGRRLFDHVSHFVGNRVPVAVATIMPTVVSTVSTTTTTTSTTTSRPETTTIAWEGATRQSSLERVNARKTTLSARTRIHKFSEKSRPKPPDHPPIAPTTPATAPTTTAPRHVNEKVIEATDYYDMYDTAADDDGGAADASKQKRRKNGEPRSLLGDVSELLQGVQDGLILAQAAFPKTSSPVAIDGQNFHLRIAITPPPPTASYRTNRIVASVGDDSSPAGPFVQQQEDEKATTIHKSATRPHPANQSRGKRKEANTIENMLQMIGLCPKHEDL